MLIVDSPIYHHPVMVTEVLHALRVRPGGRYIDCTVGQGGHALAILEASAPGGQLLGFDADPYALESARARLETYAGSFELVNDYFDRVGEVAQSAGFHPVHGALMDLGLSSMQLEGENRGFSFRRPDPLDMRFSPDQELTADDIVNTYTQTALADVLYRYGEERQSRRIADAIVRRRPIHTASELAEVVAQAVGGRRDRSHPLHPATRTFQALRVSVNRELERLEHALIQVIYLLGHGGRVAVLSYHSLEDRIVKNMLRRESKDCVCPPEVPECVCGHRATVRLIGRKAITPSREEVAANPRSRSAKLRVAEHV